VVRAGDQIENARTGQRMKFVVTGEDSSGELLRMELGSPPGPFEPVHVHPEQVSTAEVLSGSLLFMVKGHEVRVNAGERLEIPANMPHTFRNDGKDVVDWIGEFRPALRTAEFFETFFVLSQRGELDEGGMPSLLQIAVSALVFAREIRLASPPWAIQRLALGPLAPLGRLSGLQPTYAWSSLPAMVREGRVSRSSV
jgi:quercetin dioxygenase-like cupin family protein